MDLFTVVVRSIVRDAKSGVTFTAKDDATRTFRRFDTETLAAPVEVEVMVDHNAIIALAHRAAARRSGTSNEGGLKARVKVMPTFTITPVEANEEGWTAERFDGTRPKKARKVVAT